MRESTARFAFKLAGRVVLLDIYCGELKATERRDCKHNISIDTETRLRSLISGLVWLLEFLE